MARRSKARRYEVVMTDGERGPGLCERRFWILAPGVVLISVLTQTFDFSLSPPAYKGLFITRPYRGLHDWHLCPSGMGCSQPRQIWPGLYSPLPYSSKVCRHRDRAVRRPPVTDGVHTLPGEAFCGVLERLEGWQLAYLDRAPCCV